MHYKVPINKLRCPLGDSAVALEACQRVYADTPFRYNWRHTYTACCQRIRQCLSARVRPRRLPPNCRKWLPSVATIGERFAAKASGHIGMPMERWRLLERAFATNVTMCQIECQRPLDVERALAPPYRVPQAAELARLPTPLMAVAPHARQRAWLGRGCNNTPAALVAAKPWLDFHSCEREGDTHDNLNSIYGPCARELWVRLNCKRTCGLCGLGLRELVSIKPWVALKAARAAARIRGTLPPAGTARAAGAGRKAKGRG